MSNLTHSQRGEIKDYIATTVSIEWMRRHPEIEAQLPDPNDRYKWDENWFKGKTAPYLKVHDLVATWAHHSASVIQHAAAHVFLGQKSMASSPSVYAEDKLRYLCREQILQVIYDMTQQELKARGIRYVQLYRGQHDGLLSFRPLSATATSPYIAIGFSSSNWLNNSRFLYHGSIPARYIASTFFTGYGCAEEQEYVVVSMRGLRSHWKQYKEVKFI